MAVLGVGLPLHRIDNDLPRTADGFPLIPPPLNPESFYSANHFPMFPRSSWVVTQVPRARRSRVPLPRSTTQKRRSTRESDGLHASQPPRRLRTRRILPPPSPAPWGLALTHAFNVYTAAQIARFRCSYLRAQARGQREALAIYDGMLGALLDIAVALRRLWGLAVTFFRKYDALPFFLAVCVVSWPLVPPCPSR